MRFIILYITMVTLWLDNFLVSFKSLRVFLEFVLSQPPGRPIPVEAGSGERLPSIDTRAPRMRDLDAIIEVEQVSNFS